MLLLVPAVLLSCFHLRAVYYSKEYLEITVKQGDGSGLEYSKKDKENYTLVPLGDGKLSVVLKDEEKKGATAIVYDKNGRQLASRELTQIENTLDVRLEADVYFVAVQKDGVRSSKKVRLR